jgi:hypothetical protein
MARRRRRKRHIRAKLLNQKCEKWRAWQTHGTERGRMENDEKSRQNRKRK